MEHRLKDINPEVRVVARHQFLDPQAARDLAEQQCDYIVDCIDSIAPKVSLCPQPACILAPPLYHVRKVPKACRSDNPAIHVYASSGWQLLG
ncbi:MAG: hypothetical protein HC767_05370 [Akkermansiaceae bacterium]|nr:hypothetical protein [Akkermansiaceae bacterium]